MVFLSPGLRCPEWFEEKKAEGTAAAGGAVLGGMLGGPIGAVVGSQARQRAEELGGCELAAWEGSTM